MIRRLLMILVMLSMVANASAQALPARIGQEIAAVVKNKVGARGFAANDPRYTATVGAVGAAVFEIGAAVAVAGTAPAWGTVLASAALAGAVGYGVSALADWLFNTNGTVNVPGGSALPSGAGKTLTAGQPYFRCGPAPEYIGASPEDACMGRIAYYNSGAQGNYGQGTLTSCRTDGWCYQVVSVNGQTYPEQKAGSWSNMGSYTGTPCAGSMPAQGGACTAPVGTPTPPSTKPIAQALADLTPAQKATPLPAKTVADIADAAYKAAAAKPGYAGVPYSMTDPVTEADVVAARASNPAIQPSTVGDLAQPIAQTNPLGEPSTSTSPGTNPAADQPLQNLGNDPVIGAPTLEATPTAQQIIDPLAGLGPTLKSWTVPAHQSECPRPAFDLFNKHIVMDQQCTMFEQNRPTLYNAMLVAWVLIALFIVLSA